MFGKIVVTCVTSATPVLNLASLGETKAKLPNIFAFHYYF